ncbi:MAG TPA: patatin-like phospholipase family protein, partial [Symbiobacteriaceae bacterium]|nr:patatin-like phospholipase family protein [Symbiobacteriaceae bacterium]
MGQGKKQRRVEFRAAVVLYGGLSLAVYEGGASTELLHLVRASSGPSTALSRHYRRLLDALEADFTVDVIAGTSAGGINGVFLARALATGADIGVLNDLWQRHGDFSVLADWGNQQPESVLNGETFRAKLAEAIDQMQPRDGRGLAAPPKPLVQDLDLFVTSTDLAGHYWERQDS